jgi:hypothetical protein
MDNPLLDFSGLPHFGAIQPGHIVPAIDTLIREGRGTIERLAADAAPPTWENFVEPLDDVNERLARAWSQVGHLNAVVNTPALRDAYNAALPKVTPPGLACATTWPWRWRSRRCGSRRRSSRRRANVSPADAPESRCPEWRFLRRNRSAAASGSQTQWI